MESALSEGFEVIVVAKELIQNSKGTEVPTYRVFWKNTLPEIEAHWHMADVVLDPDAVSV